MFDSRARYIIGDLGRRQSRGFNLQAGFPFLSRMYTRLFVNYGLQKIQYAGGSEDLRARFRCEECTRTWAAIPATFPRYSRRPVRNARTATPISIAANSERPAKTVTRFWDGAWQPALSRTTKTAFRCWALTQPSPANHATAAPRLETSSG